MNRKFEIGDIVHGRNAGTFRVESFDTLSGTRGAWVKEVMSYNHNEDYGNPAMFFTLDMLRPIDDTPKTIENAYIMYYELHVEDETFAVHKVIFANSMEEAEAKFLKMRGKGGEHYHLQVKGGVFPLKENVAMLAEI